MHAPFAVPRLSVSDAPLADADVELLIIPVAQDHVAAAARRYQGALGEDSQSALERGEFLGKANQIYVAPAAAKEWKAARVVLVGGGPRSEITVERMRRMAVTA